MQFLVDPSSNLYFQDFVGQVGSPDNPTLPPSSNALPVTSTIGPEASGATVKAPMQAVSEFGVWLQNTAPDVYHAILVSMPSAFIPELSLMGLADTSTDLLAAGESSGIPEPVTTWGQDLMSVVEQILPAIAQYQGQRDLIKANIALAEKGQPLLSSQDLAPQLNVGVSKEMQNLAYLAIGGMIVVGVLMAIKKR